MNNETNGMSNDFADIEKEEKKKNYIIIVIILYILVIILSILLVLGLKDKKENILNDYQNNQIQINRIEEL